MTRNNEAFSRVFIDAQLKEQGWNINDYNCVRYELGRAGGLTKGIAVVFCSNGTVGH